MATFRCRVLAVDPDTGLASVENEDGRGITHDVLVGQLSANPQQGAGIRIVPKRGNTGYVTFPDDGSRPFYFGEVMPLEGEGRRHAGGHYPPLREGDMLLSGTDRNYVILRDSGVVEIGAGPLASTLLFPTANLIRSVFANLEWVSPLGSLKWKEGEDGSAALVWFINEQRGGIGGASTVTIRAGKVTDGAHAQGSQVLDYGSGINLEFVVGATGKVFGYHIDEVGQASTESDSNVFLTVRRAWEGRIGERALLNVGSGGVNVTSEGRIVIHGPGGFEMTVDSELVMKMASMKFESRHIKLGRGAMSPAVRADRLLPILVRLCMSTNNFDLLSDIPGIVSDCVEIA